MLLSGQVSIVGGSFDGSFRNFGIGGFENQEVDLEFFGGHSNIKIW